MFHVVAKSYSEFLHKHLGCLENGTYVVERTGQICRFPLNDPLGSDANTRGIRIRASALFVPEKSIVFKHSCAYVLFVVWGFVFLVYQMYVCKYVCMYVWSDTWTTKYIFTQVLCIRWRKIPLLLSHYNHICAYSARRWCKKVQTNNPALGMIILSYTHILIYSYTHTHILIYSYSYTHILI